MSTRTVRRRTRSGHGLKSWNFWTPITGTVYGVRGHWKGRVRYIYGGKTTSVPWTIRIEDHLWARHWEKQPKWWAHTVLGYRPNGTVQEVIAAGGVFIIWQARTVPLILSLVEVIYAIKIKRPVHNRQWNTGNRRRSRTADISELKWEQEMLASGLNVAHPVRARSSGGLKVGLTIAGLFMLLMFLPGMPAGNAAADLVHSLMDNLPVLIGWVFIVLAGLYTITRTKRRRSRRRSR